MLIRAGAVAAVIIWGLAAEHASFGWSEVGRWLPDLAVGVAFAVAGAETVRHRRGAGALLFAVGFTWFLGNFSPPLRFLHRGVLVNLLVALPGWRPRSPIDAAVIVAGYVAALVPPSWGSDVSGPVLALTLLALLGAKASHARGRARRDRLTALGAAAVFAVAIVGGAIARALVPARHAVEPAIHVYELALGVIAVLLAIRLRPPAAAAVADLVVELGDAEAGGLQEALSTSLGDPTLRVGYVTGDGQYVDPRGQPVAIPEDIGERAATAVEHDGEPFVLLVHDPSVLDEPTLVNAVAAATRLTAANAALSDEVRAQVAAVRESRQRLVVAADAERRRLETTLRSGVERQVDALRVRVGDLAASGDENVSAHLRRAADHLADTTVDLHRLAAGLHPRELEHGLADAVRGLVARSPVPVTVEIDDEGLDGVDDSIAVTAYYVIAEALANVAKHANADSAEISVVRHGDRLRVAASDDGCGGARPGTGSGLRGVADRVEALGGRLTVTSPAAGGTRLVAELPLGHQSPH